MSTKLPALLLSTNMQALKVIRSLGRRGIRVISLADEIGRWENSSRYCETRIVGPIRNNDAQLMQYLVALAKELDCRPVLVPLLDRDVLFMSRHWDELNEHFLFLLPAPHTAADLVSKTGVRELARQAGVPQPKIYAARNLSDVQNLAGRITYPVLIKPVFSQAWWKPEIQSIVNGKLVRVTSDAELMTMYAQLAQHDPDLTIEEEIPGPDRNLVYYVGYFDSDSQPLGSFVGIKERVTPIHYGSASYVVSKYDQKIIAQSVDFMRKLRYRGHVGIEYKYDTRDDSYKLIEVNVRFGLLDGLAAECGIDFPYINYQYVQQQSVEAKLHYDEGAKWISFERDLWAYRAYRREREVTLSGWIRSIATGRRDWAVFAWDDPLPFLLSSVALARTIMKRGATRVASHIRRR